MQCVENGELVFTGPRGLCLEILRLKIVHSNQNREAIGMLGLSAENREISIGRLQARELMEHVARGLGVYVSTIYRMWNRFQASTIAADGLRTGRRRVTTSAQD